MDPKHPHTVTTRLFNALVALAIPSLLWSVQGGVSNAAEPKPLPDFAMIERATELFFEEQPDFQPGDIIARSQVDSLFDVFERLGWTASGKEAVLKLIPADNDFVVEQLRTKAGRKFMRHISKYPDAYDRVYRLAGLPTGRRLVPELINGVGGYEMIEYLTTTQHGKELGVMLSKTATGANFDQPMNKAFTVDSLIRVLKAAYDIDRPRNGR